MIHRTLIAALAAALAAGFFAGEANAGKHFRNHWFFGYQGYYPGPEYVPPRRYGRWYYNDPEDYDDAYDEDFDETYYDPYYEPPLRKPIKKKAATSQPQLSVPKKTVKTQSPVPKTAAPLSAAAKPSSQSAAKSKGALSCEKAGSIISGYGFSAIKASDCNGQVYAFDASRGGKSYAIKLNAASGELTEVRKVR